MFIYIYIYTENDTESDTRIKDKHYNTKHTNNAQIYFQQSNTFENKQMGTFECLQTIFVIYHISIIHTLRWRHCGQNIQKNILRAY